jgi:EAL domain-containing protein (putative c-di-GMP-specific phosphodiesterase class I)
MTQSNMDVGILSQAPHSDDPRKGVLFSRRLREAIECSELSLHYQPQYRSSDGRPCGVEALARWFPRDGQPVPPVVFIRAAEQAGLISALGQWVLQEACQTAITWQLPGEEPPILCVNVSPHQICPEFSVILAQVLESTGFPASRLELEITEGILIENPELALQWLAQWKRLGVRIALDDFGTGYSSLSYLSRMPVDRLKIDRSLIQRVITDSKTAAIVRALISLGDDLGFAVLAEGVETEAQFEWLLRMRCQQMQGYLLTPPVSAREVKTLLTRRWGARPATGPIWENTSRFISVANYPQAVMSSTPRFDPNDSQILLRLEPEALRESICEPG